MAGYIDCTQFIYTDNTSQCHNPKHALGPKGSDNANILFTRNGFIKLLKKLDPQKACGPDNITACFLKECAEVIADAFVQLFNVSLEQGKVPDDCKKVLSPQFTKEEINPDRLQKVIDQ